jgi:hypothetical protein
LKILAPLALLLVTYGVVRSEDLPKGSPKPRKLDPVAILAALRDVSLAGMDRRLGPDYAFYHKNGPPEQFPRIWMPEVKEGGPGRRWEIGGPWVQDAGDFSSTQGQILYVPDQGIGVDRVTISEWSNGCFSEKPEPPWNCDSRPEPTSAKWQDSLAKHPGAPLFMARGMGPQGKDRFECGGVLEFPGAPFCISATNVN